MSDSQPTVWSANQHTIAKHQILQAYLSAWLPILSRQSQKLGAPQGTIKYIDGFAGPGIYKNGEKGSPVLALETALNHTQDFPVPVELIFIERNDERFAILKQQLEPYTTQIAASKNVRSVRPICGDCRQIIDAMLDEATTNLQKFGPALAFLDQFGYSAVPMDLIARVLAQRQCEVLTFLFWRDLDRFITDASKHSGITTAFGGTEWSQAIAMDSVKRQQFMHDLYAKSLKERANAKYVWSFVMADQNSQPLCWLFFCTNAPRGLEEMKKAMWKVDQTGSFFFSDEHGLNQLSLLTSYGNDRLETDMQRRLAGKKMSVREVQEWMLTETPAYLFKIALAKLEKRGVAKPINPPPGRKPYTYPDAQLGMLIEFEPALF